MWRFINKTCAEGDTCRVCTCAHADACVTPAPACARERTLPVTEHGAVEDAKFMCYIKAEAGMPVKDVTLRDIKVRTVRGTPVFTENVQGFVNRA
jgi:hypothetical protein